MTASQEWGESKARREAEWTRRVEQTTPRFLSQTCHLDLVVFFQGQERSRSLQPLEDVAESAPASTPWEMLELLKGIVTCGLGAHPQTAANQHTYTMSATVCTLPGHGRYHLFQEAPSDTPAAHHATCTLVINSFHSTRHWLSVSLPPSP